MGDSGFPVEPCLLTPILEPESRKELKYNKAHKSARNVIERNFGYLKSRFRCMSQHRTLHYSPKVAANIILSCVILHNICMAKRFPIDEDEDLEEFVDVNEAVRAAGEVNNLLAVGRRKRLQYINNTF